jgi:CRP-like cAMP-binding protein
MYHPGIESGRDRLNPYLILFSRLFIISNRNPFPLCNEINNIIFHSIGMGMKSGSALRDQLRENLLFIGVDDILLRNLANKMSKVKLAAGKAIFEDESPGNCMFLILSGEVTISKAIRTGGDIVLGILRQHDFFGELDLIDKLHRSARAVATTDCELARLEQNEFQMLMDASPCFSRNLFR